PARILASAWTITALVSGARAVAAAFLVTAGACTTSENTFVVGEDASARCTAGASLACACTDGRTGAQVCMADGTLGPCACADEVDATVSTDASGDGAITEDGNIRRDATSREDASDATTDGETDSSRSDSSDDARADADAMPDAGTVTDAGAPDTCSTPP